jgi:hypothetical protein
VICTEYVRLVGGQVLDALDDAHLDMLIEEVGVVADTLVVDMNLNSHHFTTIGPLIQ